MAFIGLPEIDLGGASFTKALQKSTKKASKVMEIYGKVQKKVNKEIEKSGSKTKFVAKMFGKITDSATAAGSHMLNTIGLFLQMANSLGILQPIIQLITGLLSMIGGAAMEVLAPAIAELAEVLFSPAMIEIWGLLGETIGFFLRTILESIAQLLGDPEFQKVLKVFIQIIGNILMFFATVLGWFFDILSGMSAQELGRLFFALGVAIAFFYGIAQGGGTWFGLILGTLFATLAAIALAPLLGLAEGGIVTKPTIALIGEAGPEAVIPLKEGGAIGTQDEYTQKEILWQQEENGKKLDRIYMALTNRRRLL